MAKVIMKNSRFIIASAPLSKEIRHAVFNKKLSDKLTFCINTNREPWRFKITTDMVERWQTRQEIKQASKTNHSPEGLYYLAVAVEKDIAEMAGKDEIHYWDAWKRHLAYETIYEVAFNRGVRRERQRRKVKESNKKHSAIELMGADDVIELSQALGIDESQVLRACLETSAKRMSGGKA